MQMYRKPRISVIDRHTLIELDGDFTDQEIKHLLRKAYENHKAPHEYDDIKKYIRDMVIGEHNSVYQQAGSPSTAAAAAVLMPSNTLNWTPNQNGAPYDLIYNSTGSCTGCCMWVHSQCVGTPFSFGYGLPLVNYDNGTAIGWLPLYSQSAWTSGVAVNTPTSCPSSGSFVVVPSTYNFYPNYVAPKYLYAPYITSTNPLTLSTYHYWVYPTSWSTATYSYVYFNLLGNDQYGSTYYAYISIFYTTGTFSLNPGTAYLTMWQWTYT